MARMPEKIIVELSEYDRVLISQLIDRLKNPAPPTLPSPYTSDTPQWWQNPVTCESLGSNEGVPFNGIYAEGTK